MEESLWGESFSTSATEEKEKTKQILKKKERNKNNSKAPSKQKKISKSLTLAERLAEIELEVHRILGQRIADTVVIRDFNEYINYIKSGIAQGRIAIDTETNNSLSPITCKIMGLCLQSPGQKAAYIPVNHRDCETKLRLPDQLNEDQIADGLRLINDSNILQIYHNGKFDYQVLKCTCGVPMHIYWDTLIGAKLLDENEDSAKLKDQFISKIDPTQEKYSIDHLFKGVEYADVAPELFALYAATDSMMTDKLYLWQMDKFKSPELKDVLQLAYDVEMPLTNVIGDMELAGIAVDMDYAQRLSSKYHKKLDAIANQIQDELVKLKPQIDLWRLTPEANAKQLTKKRKTDESAVDELKTGKSKNEQLQDPINLASSTQLAILFYDVLKCPTVNKKKPRSTDEDTLKLIAQKINSPVCSLLLDWRSLNKTVTTYVDVIPSLAAEQPDGRVRTHFNQYGAATGRLSSSEPLNLQNIPSEEKNIRSIFQARCVSDKIIADNNTFIVPECAKVDTPDGMKFVSELNCGDSLRLTDNDSFEDVLIRSINVRDDEYLVCY